jgi:hypothetical protein
VVNMSTWKFLQDHFIGGRYYQAGETAFTADIPGGSLPAGWPGSANAEPMDAPAVNAFWALANTSGLLGTGGWSPVGLVRQQWSGIPVNPPITYFKPVPGSASPNRLYQMTGLGAGLPPILGGS